MGMKKINRWFKSLIHGYDLPQLKNRNRGQLAERQDMHSGTACDDEAIGAGGLLAKYGSSMRRDFADGRAVERQRKHSGRNS